MRTISKADLLYFLNNKINENIRDEINNYLLTNFKDFSEQDLNAILYSGYLEDFPKLAIAQYCQKVRGMETCDIISKMEESLTEKLRYIPEIIPSFIPRLLEDVNCIITEKDYAEFIVKQLNDTYDGKIPEDILRLFTRDGCFAPAKLNKHAREALCKALEQCHDSNAHFIQTDLRESIETTEAGHSLKEILSQTGLPVFLQRANKIKPQWAENIVSLLLRSEDPAKEVTFFTQVFSFSSLLREQNDAIRDALKERIDTIHDVSMASIVKLYSMFSFFRYKDNLQNFIEDLVSLINKIPQKNQQTQIQNLVNEFSNAAFKEEFLKYLNEIFKQN